MEIESAAGGAPSAPRQQLAYDGRLGELYGIFIVNMLLSLVTLGFYRFWAKTRMRGFPVLVGPSGVLWAGPAQKSFDKGRTVIRTRWSSSLGAQTLARDPRNSDVAYGGHAYAGIAKTVDGGTTWQTRNQGLWASTITSLAIAPDRPSRVYANAAGEGLLSSWNGGMTWRALTLAADSEFTRLNAGMWSG